MLHTSKLNNGVKYNSWILSFLEKTQPFLENGKLIWKGNFTFTWWQVNEMEQYIPVWHPTWSNEYGNIKMVWLKVLPKNMVLKYWYTTKSIKMLKVLLNEKNKLKNGREHGNWIWLTIKIPDGMICIRVYANRSGVHSSMDSGSFINSAGKIKSSL